MGRNRRADKSYHLVEGALGSGEREDEDVSLEELLKTLRREAKLQEIYRDKNDERRAMRVRAHMGTSRVSERILRIKKRAKRKVKKRKPY